MDINNKVAFITGGASGLGEATVRRFAKLGAKIALFDMNKERGQEIADEIANDPESKDAGAEVLVFEGNVTDESTIKAAIAGTEDAFGPLHICCNYAGIGSAEKTYSTKKGVHSMDAFKRVIDINLVGTFNVASLAAESMAKNESLTDDGQRGVIINTASVAGYEGQIGQVAYSASKGGIIGMTIVIARDLADLGIRCNTIVPGLIHTPLFDSLAEPVYNSLAASVLNPSRLGKPDEIAMTAQYMVENDYVNGECIRMDGGIRMQAR